MGQYTIQLVAENITINVKEGVTLLDALISAERVPETPCGGQGTCGKCRVFVDGVECLACQTIVNRNMTVVLSEIENTSVMTIGIDTDIVIDPLRDGYLMAFDIGTTTVVGYLLDGVTGRELANASVLNPQAPYGADVITRIQAALHGKLNELTDSICNGLTELVKEVCEKAQSRPDEIYKVAVVGNPAMQQLFLGLMPGNLAAVPFNPILTKAEIFPARGFLPICENADLLIAPDISGYVGADTMGCVLSTRMYETDEIVLMVDIGTNGEMVLSNRGRMLACSTAAGPALEGAKIKFGMRGADGAIDHVWMEDGKLCCSVIGGGEARGICGSGLIDAVAVMLETGLINKRGRIQTTEEIDDQRIIHLTDTVYLTQDDMHEVQLAKGAIAAGIELMAEQMGLTVADIDKVLLAGAFGSFMKAESACRIGLLPPVLNGKITTIGNAAGSGAKMIVCNGEEFQRTQRLKDEIGFIELAGLPRFQRAFAKNMNYPEM